MRLPDLFTSRGYEHEKQEALRSMRHAIEQAEKDQWLNALRALGSAVVSGTAALQSIVNRDYWTH